MSEETMQNSEQIVLQSVTFYIDSEYRCYTVPGEGRREMQSSFFFGRESDIGHYRFVPSGEIWVNNEGFSFFGEMITPIEN